MRITTKFEFFITNIQPPHQLTELQFNNSFLPEFYFVENMEGMYLIGELCIYDKQGFFETINFTGKEIIRLIMTQDLEGERDKKQYRKIIDFDIYDASISDMKAKNNIFKFKLVEKGALDFYGANFNKGYTNKKVSDIVTDVLSTQLNLNSIDYDIEPTHDIIENFVIPFWKPALTIKGLRKKARRLITPHEGGYLFYSTTGDGETKKLSNGILSPTKKFVSFASLIEKPFINDMFHNYIFKNFDANPMFINTIKEAESSTYGNRSLLKDGIGGKKYFGIDYNTDKNIIETKEKYSDYFKKVKTLGNVAFFDKNIDGVNDDVDFIGGPSYVVDSLKDNSFRCLLNTYLKRDIIVEGALFRHAGQVIFLEQISDRGDGLHHKHDFGKWLIKAITHNYKDGLYIQRITLMKDSYTDTGLTGSMVIKK